MLDDLFICTVEGGHSKKSTVSRLSLSLSLSLVITKSPVADIMLVVAIRESSQYVGHELHGIPFAVSTFFRFGLLDDTVEQLSTGTKLGHLSSPFSGGAAGGEGGRQKFIHLSAK